MIRVDFGLASSYSGRKQLGCRFARFERLQALAYVVAEQGEGNPSEARRIAVEAFERRLQQQHGSQRIVALQVMERRGHLDQPLQKRLLRLGRTQPHAFPGLMCGKKLARIVQSQAFRQGAFAPIECHNQRAEDYKLARSSIDVPGLANGCTLFRSIRSSKGNPDSGRGIESGTPCLPPAMAGVL
jgi:hypothetical protein